MTVVPADVITRFPDFELVENVRIQEFIDEAERNVKRSVFGSRDDDAVIFLTAHLLEIDDGGSDGSVGPVQSEKVGPLSRSHAVPSVFDDSMLATTNGGRMFKDLIRNSFADRVI